jgi:hypothetical protein
MNQRVEFLTDGGDTVRELPLYLCPESEHWLDWFHITMRLTVMGQITKGLTAENGPGTRPGDDGEGDSRRDVTALDKQLESLKWHLWHGNVSRALQTIEDLEWDLESQEARSERVKRLLRTVSEFHHYIESNRDSIPNSGDRHRHGERISTAFAESTVNPVVSKRMVKKQPMGWTERGAHLLLQVRRQVLNDDLRRTFERLYPGMKADTAQTEEVAA